MYFKRGASTLSLSLSIAQRTLGSFLAPFFLFVFVFVPLAAQATLYAPGATLDPACAPTDSNCGVQTVGSGTAGQIPYYAGTGAALTATSSITILSNGYVGVGTTTPFKLFSVNGQAYFSGTTTVTNLITAEGPQVDVRAYGAVGDGVTDDTTAFNSAIASLGSKGGTILVPPGKYAVNLVITQDNVRIQGASTYEGSSGATSNYLIPYSASSPVIQVGNDTKLVQGVHLENLTFYGGNNSGQTGLYLYGGSYRNTFSNLTIKAFTLYGIRLRDGTTYPVAYNFFRDVVIQPHSSSDPAVVALDSTDSSGGSYTAANYFTNLNVSGVSAGYAIRVDGTQLDLSNTWIQAQADHGIYFASSGSRISASNVEVDSDSSSDSLVEVYNTDRVISDFIFGTYSIDGYLKLSNASTVSLSGKGSLYYQGQLSYPYVVGDMGFTPTTEASYSNTRRIYATASNLFIDNQVGSIFFTPSANSIFNSGKVGIGTTSPYAALSVAGQGVFDNIWATSTSAVNYFAGKIGMSTTSPQATIGLAGSLGVSSKHLVLSSGGNVSIGTTTELARLTVDGSIEIPNNTAYRALDNAGNGVSLLTISTANNIGYTGSTVSGSMQFSVPNSSGSFQFLTGSGLTNVMQITNAGKVGIGTTSPYASLSVVGQVVGAYFTATTSTASTFAGGVGIATTSPWRTFSVTGTVGFDGLTGSTGAGSICLSSNKEIVYNSGSDACLSSLRATKHDITPLTVDATTLINALQPVSFIYNDDASSTVRYGFIAEDAASVDTHFATHNANGNISGIDDRSIISVLVKAVQELYALVMSKFDSEDARIKALEDRVQVLEAKENITPPPVGPSTSSGSPSGGEETAPAPAESTPPDESSQQPDSSVGDTTATRETPPDTAPEPASTDTPTQ